MERSEPNPESRSLQEWMTEFRQDEKAMKCLKITLIVVGVIGAIGVLVGITGTLSLIGGASFATVPLQVLHGAIPMPLNVVMAYTGGVGAVILLAVGTVPLAICVLGEKKAEEISFEESESENDWEEDPNIYSLTTMDVAAKGDETTLNFTPLDKDTVEKYIDKNKAGSLKEALTDLKAMFLYKDTDGQMHMHCFFHNNLNSQTKHFNFATAVIFARTMECEYMISDFDQLQGLATQRHEGYHYDPKRPDDYNFPDIKAALVKIPPKGS